MTVNHVFVQEDAAPVRKSQLQVSKRPRRKFTEELKSEAVRGVLKIALAERLAVGT